MTNPIWQWSAVETAKAIRNKTVSCVEVMQAHIGRIQEKNRTLNAITVDLSGQALEQARAADNISASGIAPGPLHGVPVTIKENIDVKGQATPNGVADYADIIAPDDSPVVSNLKKAGAIIIGRTNTPEFSFRAFTDNPLRGLTVNPWRPDITCGGSSGGAGVCAAMGMGAIAHGNDIGGSLRFPANFCGVTTIKPTLGRVPAYNPSASEERPPLMQLMSVQGPITRTVEDARLGLQVMAQRDPRDPWWVPVALRGEHIAAPIKVALSKNDFGHSIHPAVAAALDRAADILSRNGYLVEEAEPPGIPDIVKHWCSMTFTEFKMMMDKAVREHASETMHRIVDAYYDRSELFDFESYMRGFAERSAYLRRWNLFLEDYPIVLTPATLCPPFPVNNDEKSADHAFSIYEKGIYITCMNLLGLPAAIAPVAVHDNMPIGVQLVSRRYREDLCLDAAQAIENEIGILAARLWAQET